MTLSKQLIIAVALASAILSACSENECDKLYAEVKIAIDEYVATSKKLKQDPTNQALLIKYMKLAQDIADITKRETPCTANDEFKIKVMTLVQEASTNEIKPAELDAARNSQHLTNREHPQAQEKYVAKEQKDYTDVSSDEREANWAVTGTYSGQFGEENITIEITYVSPNGDEIVGYNKVAENKRELKGSVTGLTAKGDKMLTLKEPGNHKYDGEFQIIMTEGGMIGEWSQYKGNSTKEFELVKQ